MAICDDNLDGGGERDIAWGNKSEIRHIAINADDHTVGDTDEYIKS